MSGAVVHVAKRGVRYGGRLYQAGEELPEMPEEAAAELVALGAAEAVEVAEPVEPVKGTEPEDPDKGDVDVSAGADKPGGKAGGKKPTKS